MTPSMLHPHEVVPNLVSCCHADKFAMEGNLLVVLPDLVSREDVRPDNPCHVKGGLARSSGAFPASSVGLMLCAFTGAHQQNIRVKAQ